MTNQPTPSRSMSLEAAAAAYLRELEGKNRSATTLRAYQTDLRQFLAWLEETNGTIEGPADVRRSDISEYLTHLGRSGQTGVSRQRKLSAIRGLFAYLEAEGVISKSPVLSVATPKVEQHEPVALRQDEYARMLNLARHSSRDTAILSIFIRLGLRVSELCALELEDIDLTAATLKVRSGKGQRDRTLEIDRKTLSALRQWQKERPAAPHDYLFTSDRNLNYRPLSVRGVRWLVNKYLAEAGITKKASCHTLRHTCATVRYAKGASLLVVQRIMGHRSLSTTQLYLHPERQDTKQVMESTNP